MIHKIRLPALLGSHPLGMLASIGLLRKVAEWDAAAKLEFVMDDDWIAVVRTRAASDAVGLVDKLVEWIGGDSLDRLLDWADDVRIAPEAFRQRLTAALDDGDLEMAGFLSALIADGAVDGQKGLTKPCGFYMVSGQQSFLGGMREIVRQVRVDARVAFEEALIGPWRYRIRAHSLGWDPNTERLYALRHRAPTSEKPVCIGGAILLAFWALPLFPAVAIDGRASTVGFIRTEKGQCFTWPVWSVPVSLDELTSLLHCGEKAWMAGEPRVARSGIRALYRSRRAEFGQGYAVLRAPEIVYTAPMTAESHAG